MVVTPLAVLAPYWAKLLGASVVGNNKGYIHSPRLSTRLPS
jgi:hypothetical protein